jgi:AcrR family transcriptional regulator
MRTRTDSRERLLNAASAIVARHGAGNLTIDAVAAESGLSKGGVLYHFPNKHALLGGMLEKLVDQLQGRLTELKTSAGASELTALLQAIVGRSTEEKAMSQALLANAAEDPSLLSPAKPVIQSIVDNIAGESTDTQLALILWLAAEGLRFMDMLDILPQQTLDEHGVSDRMLALAEGLRS